MREYEILFIIDPSKEASFEDISRNLTTLISKLKGNISKEENLGKQRMAYQIRKVDEGLFYKVNFTAEPTIIAELNNTYKLNNDILRFMITAK